MSDYVTGPTWAEVVETLRRERERHARAWGADHGLSDTEGQVADLDTVEQLLRRFGVGIDLPNLGPADDFVVVTHRGAGGVALLVAYGQAPCRYREQDGRASIAESSLPPVVLAGWPRAAEEDLAHKVLAAAGLVPYRNRGTGERYRITWTADGEPRVVAVE